MADKKVILAGEYADRLALTDAVYAIDTLSSSQHYAILLSATERLPAKVVLEQRSYKGTVDLQIGDARFKINRRGKLHQSYLLLN
jgi:hypothetical protein